MHKDSQRLKEDLEAYYSLVEKLKQEKGTLRHTLQNIMSKAGAIKDQEIREIIYEQIGKALNETDTKEEF